MKTKLLLLSLCLNSISFGQNISFNDIKYLQEHDVYKCNKYLIKLDFTSLQYFNLDGETPFNQWSYPKSGQAMDNFQAFIGKYGTKACIGLVKPDDGMIGFTTRNKKLFYNIIQQFKDHGFTYDNNDNGKIKLVSADRKYFFEYILTPNEYGLLVMGYY